MLEFRDNLVVMKKEQFKVSGDLGDERIDMTAVMKGHVKYPRPSLSIEANQVVVYRPAGNGFAHEILMLLGEGVARKEWSGLVYFPRTVPMECVALEIQGRTRRCEFHGKTYYLQENDRMVYHGMPVVFLQEVQQYDWEVASSWSYDWMKKPEVTMGVADVLSASVPDQVVAAYINKNTMYQIEGVPVNMTVEHYRDYLLMFSDRLLLKYLGEKGVIHDVKKKWIYQTALLAVGPESINQNHDVVIISEERELPHLPVYEVDAEDQLEEYSRQDFEESFTLWSGDDEGELERSKAIMKERLVDSMIKASPAYKEVMIVGLDRELEQMLLLHDINVTHYCGPGTKWAGDVVDAVVMSFTLSESVRSSSLLALMQCVTDHIYVLDYFAETESDMCNLTKQQIGVHNLDLDSHRLLIDEHFRLKRSFFRSYWLEDYWTSEEWDGNGIFKAEWHNKGLRKEVMVFTPCYVGKVKDVIFHVKAPEAVLKVLVPQKQYTVYMNRVVRAKYKEQESRTEEEKKQVLSMRQLVGQQRLTLQQIVNMSKKTSTDNDLHYSRVRKTLSHLVSEGGVMQVQVGDEVYYEILQEEELTQKDNT